MRVAISCEGNGLNGKVAEHFGRCPEFIIAEVKGAKIVSSKRVENPYYNNHVPGAVPKFISELKADVLITGGIGPAAVEMFKTMKIKVVYGVNGSVKKILGDYLGKKIMVNENACHH